MTNLSLSQEAIKQEAAKELLKRRMAKDSLMAFTRTTFPAYRPSRHHYEISEKLEEVEKNNIKRIIFNLGPRHGKSEKVSRRFPAWFLGKNPTRSFGHVSYGQSFADEFGEDVRNIMRLPSYQHIFDTRISKSSSAKNKWKTIDGGSYYAVGVGGPQTGRGYDILNIDDPHKDREEADSERYRNKVWRWFCGTAYTRLESDILIPDDDWNWLFENPDVALKEGLVKPFEGAIMLTQTRWHEDDLTGRLIEAMEKGGEQYEIINMPSSDEKVTYALWPEKYPVKALKRIKESLGDRDYSAQHLQNPTPLDGNYFKRHMFLKRWSVLPSDLQFFAAGDFALSLDKGDYTEIGIFGVDPSRNIYIVDWFSGQCLSDTWINELFELKKKWDFSWMAAEQGQIKLATQSTIQERMKRDSLFFGLQYIGGGKSKEANAASFYTLQASGVVFWPEKGYGTSIDHAKLCSITDRVIEQLIKAFGGRYDDAIDACSCFGLKITEAWTKTKKPKPKPEAKQIDHTYTVRKSAFK